jgi:ABC-type branched-subunit amino acid transport system ATPase component
VARKPDCLLADEPLQGLAPLDAELVGQALRSMARCGCAVIASGHEVPALLEVADEVVWQTAGTTHLLGSPDQARSNHQFVREYLGLAGLAG